MNKINVAFVICKNEFENWNGGMSYLRNLINLIKNLKELKIHVFTDSKNFVRNKITRDIQIIENKIFKKNSLFFFFRKIIIFFFKRDFLLFNLLKKRKIIVLSHRKLFINKQIKSIGWIPDLQQKVMKKFFDKKNYILRENYIFSEIKNSDYIFVSSKQIKKEFKQYYNLDKKIIALRIPSILKKRIYNNFSKKKYIFFPSQFWIHKNHEIILKTAEILKKKNINIMFILSGSKIYYRAKDYYIKLKKKIKKKNIGNYVQIKGNVDFKSLHNFQTRAIAMINPSFYEGWSTINEEAKALNKYIFLSNIPGHIEQRNSGSIYFPPNNPHMLVRKIKSFLKKKNYLNERKLEKKNKLFYNKIKNEAVRQLLKVYKSKQ